MCFELATGYSWIGNFQPGFGEFSGLVELPDGDVVVVSTGQAYVVEPSTQLLKRTFGGDICYATWVAEISALIVCNGLWFEAIGPGCEWRSPRVSWDGIRAVRIDGGLLYGEAYDPMTDSWSDFRLDLTTGQPDGGTYNGPDSAMV